MKKYVCDVCGWEYDPAQGTEGVAPGTPWEQVAEDFVCPLCKHGAEDFEKKEAPSAAPAKPEPAPAGAKNKFVCPICGYSQESEADELTCVICQAKMNKV